MKRVLTPSILPSWPCRTLLPRVFAPACFDGSCRQQVTYCQAPNLLAAHQQRFLHINQYPKYPKNRILARDNPSISKRCHSQLSRKAKNELNSLRARNTEGELDSILHKIRTKPQSLDLEEFYDFLHRYASSSNNVNVNSMVNIIQQYRKSPVGDQLTVRAYNAVLAAYDTLRQAEKATKLFEWLHDQEANFHPNSQTYLKMIKIYKNGSEPKMALATLDKLCQKVKDGSMDPSDMDTQHFNLVLASWLPFAKDDPIVPSMISEVLEKFQSKNVPPNDITMNTIISLYVRRGDSDKAEEMFRRMRNDFDVPANTSAFTTLMSSWYQKREFDNVQTLYDEYQQLYQSSPDNIKLKPNANIYTTLMFTKARMGDAETVSQLLNEWIQKEQAGIISVKPKTREFSAVVQAWTKSEHPEASLRAEKGLRQMLELYESGQFESLPNVMVFTQVITAHAQFGKGERAFPLFQKLEQLAKQYPKNKHLRPDLRLYQKVIFALSRSSDPRASEKVEFLLMTLLDKDNSFWNHNITEAIDVISIIQKTLEGSTLERRHKLLDATDRLERLARQRGAR